MTGSLCGLPHYEHTESLCTEPAGHYIPDRDPHAGPLIINGRECGGISWDEPKDTPMTSDNAPTLNKPGEKFTPEVKGPEPRLTASTINDTQLDQLYDRLNRAEAALTRVRDLTVEYPAGIDTALIEEALDTTRPTATQATDEPT